MENFKTKDRFEIYALLATGAEVEKTEKDYRSVSIYFKDKEACEKTLLQLLNKKLIVNAHEMIEAMRTAQILFTR